LRDACHRDDGDPFDTAESTDPLAEPDAESAVRFVTQPQPSQLDHSNASFGIAGLADALIAARGAALEVSRCQPYIARQFAAIGKRAIEQFASQYGGAESVIATS
jgi:hypothetical protein